jgi:hypothetical protein
MDISRFERRGRFFALLSCFSVAAFVLVCGSVQFLRSDLDWIAAPLSYYLVGPFGSAVIAAYLALSVGLVALGCGFRAALAPAARSAAPLLLFVVAGFALALTALSEQAKAQGSALEWEIVHRLAAMTTFLCVTVAMLLQSFRLRFDPDWRGRFGFAFALAAVAFAALWIHVLVHSLPRGLAQKGVIVLILTWLGWASWALRRETR